MKIPPGFILIAIVIAGGVGYCQFQPKDNVETPSISQRDNTGVLAPILPDTVASPPQFPPALPEIANSNSLPVPTFAGPTTIIGSTSLNELGVALKNYGVTYEAKGSNAAITAVSNNQASMGAISRPLTPDEKARGLQEHAIGNDSIAFVVTQDSVAPVSVTIQELQAILAGSITNWNQVGGEDSPIKLVLRGDGGTRKSVRQIFRLESGFGSNAIDLVADDTTLMLNTLDSSSIGFSTAIQVCNQQTVRALNIDSKGIDSPNYVPQRQVFFITKGDPTADQVNIITAARQIYQQKSAPVLCANYDPTNPNIR